MSFDNRMIQNYIQHMRFKPLSLKRLILLLVFVVPLIAWMLVKPVRVVAPQLVNITCPTASVCVDDIARFQVAENLYAEALNFVSSGLGPVTGPQKMIFCSSESCAQSFGLGARSAVTLGTFGTVIGPRAWRPYYVRHEMIHYLQGEKLGVWRLLFMPSWFIEGMAYALSEDPREKLAEPFEEYRRTFLSWYASVEKKHLWTEAKKL